MTKYGERIFALLRFAFGCVWAIDAWLKWQPAFISNFTTVVGQAADGQPAWIAAWIHLWVSIVSVHPYAWAIAVALAETAIAIGLLFGFFTRTALAGGIVLSLLIWSIPQGFGGPYMPGMPDIGAGIIYIFVMLALWAGSCWKQYSVDALLAKRWNFALWKSKPTSSQYEKNDVIVHILMFAVIFLGAILFVFMAPASSTPTTGPGAMAPAGMMLKTYEVPAGYPTPTVDFTITRDPAAMGGWDVHITTTNFTFTPQNVNTAPVPDQGHAHIYVDNTLYVAYGPWYHLDDLSPGTHTITVALAQNDHSIYTKNGVNIQKQETISQ